MKQLALDLGTEEGGGVASPLAGDLQEPVVVLMAAALLALVVDDPRHAARGDREERHE